MRRSNAPIDSTVVWLTFRQLFVRRRLIAAALWALAPLAIALLFRLSRDSDGPERVRFIATLYKEIVLGTLLPLAAAVLGTTAFGGEIDDGTIVYLLIKPLRRWRVVLSKYVVAVVSTIAVILPGVVLPWIALGPSLVPSALLRGFATAALLGSALYCALFVALGLASRRALVVGLFYIVVLEFVLSRQIAGIKSLSVREFGLTMAATLAPDQKGLILATVSQATVWTMGGIIVAGSLLLAVRYLQKYEMAEQL